MTCNVCVSDYTKVLRKPIKCPFCEYDACSTCIQQYLLSTPETPHCMSCRKSWSRNFISKEFTMKFLNTTYKQHREVILFDKERALMPMTQEYAERELFRRKMDADILLINTRKSLLVGELSQMYPITIDDKMKEIRTKLLIYEYDLQIELCLFRKGDTHKQTTETRKQFVKACAKNECKGFLSTQWVCGLCENKTCKDCGEVISEGHECNEDNVKTQLLLAKDTKTCPKCAAMIFKIDGCDQMFCTECHTAFSWRTGRVETGVCHNPHYYEYRRQNGLLDRPIGDIQCGGMPYIGQVMQVARNSHPMITSIHRRIVELQDIGMTKYQNLPINNPQVNQKDRILYMINELSEADFKRKLQMTDKDLNKRLEIGQILSTFIQVVCDHFNILIAERNCSDFMDKYDATCEYFNKMLLDVSFAYQCSVPNITGAFIHTVRW